MDDAGSCNGRDMVGAVGVVGTVGAVHVLLELGGASVVVRGVWNHAETVGHSRVASCTAMIFFRRNGAYGKGG